MNCPHCYSERTNVTETRQASPRKPYGTRRRRYCNECQHRWTTIELNAEIFVVMLNLWDQLRHLYTLVGAVPSEVFTVLQELFEDSKAMRTNSSVTGSRGT